MNKRSGWFIWGGLLVAVLGIFGYMTVFVNFPSTRDVPWATLLIFAVALTLAAVGLRRVFQQDSGRGRKIVGAVGAILTVALVGLFVFGFYIASKQLPASKGAPQVGQKAPEFRLSDSNGKSVALSELLTSPVNGKAPRGVLLVFYRGYW